MHWEVSYNQSFLWSENPRSSVIEEGTAKPSYSRPGAMALSRGNFISYLKSCLSDLKQLRLICVEFTALLSTVTAHTNNKNPDKGGKHFILKRITKKSLRWGTLAERSFIFLKQNYPRDSTLTFSPNVLRNGRHCYFCPSRSNDAETSFCKTGFSQPWAYNLSSMVLQHSNYSANAGFCCCLWNITHLQI